MMPDMDKSALSVAVRQWHEAMSAHKLSVVRQSAHRLAARGSIRVGHLWAGSNTGMKTLMAIRDYWASAFGELISFEESWAVEIHEETRGFISVEFPNCIVIAKDVHQVASSSRSYCVKAKSEVLLAPVDFVDGGYPCQTKSPLNTRNRAGSGTCIQRGDGKTGKGFESTQIIIQKFKPEAFMLENRPFKDSDADGPDVETDIDFVVTTLEADGTYKTLVRNVEAADYGSISHRKRSYLSGFSGENAQRKIDFANDLLPDIKIPALSPWMFIPDDPSLLHFLSAKGDEAANQDEMLYRDIHLEAYQQYGIAYPASFDDMPVAFTDALVGLNTRAIEIVYFLEKTRPYPSTHNTPQFCDINMSLEFLVGHDFTKVGLTEVAPTLACSTILWFRIQLSDDEFVWRVISGKHLLRISGWGDPSGTYDPLLFRRLAGNAYSAFAAGPVLLGILVGMGME